MIFCFYLWTKAVNTGSLLWAGLTTLSYLYMVACWGGYIFLINLIPVYVLVMLFTGRYSNRLYVAYNTFYVLGTLLSMQIRFVGFNAVQTSEHLGAFGTFGLLNLYCVATWVQSFTGPKVFNAFVRWLALFALSIVGMSILLAFVMGHGGGMTGFRQFLDRRMHPSTSQSLRLCRNISRPPGVHTFLICISLCTSCLLDGITASRNYLMRT